MIGGSILLHCTAWFTKYARYCLKPEQKKIKIDFPSFEAKDKQLIFCLKEIISYQNHTSLSKVKNHWGLNKYKKEDSEEKGDEV